MQGYPVSWLFLSLSLRFCSLYLAFGWTRLFEKLGWISVLYFMCKSVQQEACIFLCRMISGRLISRPFTFLFAMFGCVVYLFATPSLFFFGGKRDSASFLWLPTTVSFFSTGILLMFFNIYSLFQYWTFFTRQMELYLANSLWNLYENASCLKMKFASLFQIYISDIGKIVSSLWMFI